MADATTAVTGNVLANDADASGTQLTVKNAGDYEGTYGTLSLASDGSYSYLLDSGMPSCGRLAQSDGHGVVRVRALPRARLRMSSATTWP